MSMNQMTEAVAVVDVAGPGGTVWKTIIKVLPSNVLSVAVEEIGGDILDAPSGFDLYLDPNSGQLKPTHGFDWDREPIKMWRDRLGECFAVAVRQWEQAASRLKTGKVPQDKPRA